MYILFERVNDYEITVLAFNLKSKAKKYIDENIQRQYNCAENDIIPYYHYRLHDGTGYCDSSPNAHVHFPMDCDMRFSGII